MDGRTQVYYSLKSPPNLKGLPGPGGQRDGIHPIENYVRPDLGWTPSQPGERPDEGILARHGRGPTHVC